MLKKGKELKSTNERWDSLYRGVRRSFHRRHESKDCWEEAWFYISSFMSERRRYTAYLENLPKRFSKRVYTDTQYQIDIKNVLEHYTKWNREDFWRAKKSLKRTKQYEKREGLEPFHEILTEQKRVATMLRDQERDNEYYLASRNQLSLV